MIPDLENAILDRLLNDNTGTGNLNSLVGSRITNIQGSRVTLTFPYIVFQVVGTQINDTLTADGVMATVELHVFDKVESSNVTSNAILARIRGDAVSQSDRNPTYGIHRWIVGTLGSGGWVGGQCHIVNESAQHELNYLHYVVTATVSAQLGT